MEKDIERAKRENLAELLRTSDFYSYKPTPEKSEFFKLARDYHFSKTETQDVSKISNRMSNVDGRERVYGNANSCVTGAGCLSGLAGSVLGLVAGYLISDVFFDSNFVKNTIAFASGCVGFKTLEYVGAKVGVNEFIRKNK